MGNRASVIFTDGVSYSPSVYLHWNGGPESVYAFLAELDRRLIRTDVEYQPARFIHVAADLFDNGERGAGGLSLGVINGPTQADVDTAGSGGLNLWDPGDNGLFIIHRTGPGHFAVRRWVGGRWLSAENVGYERLAAERHEYAAEFRETFAKLRPVIQAD